MLFGESQGRVVVSCALKDAAKLTAIARRWRVRCATIGTVGGGGSLRIQGCSGGRIHAWIDVQAHELAAQWVTAIERRMEQSG